MKNIYEVVIKHPNGSKTTGSAAGEWMTSQDAINYVLNKMPKRRREGIIEGVESGEYEIEVNADVNNDMDMNELSAIVKDERLVFSADNERVYCEVVEENQDTFLLCRTDSVNEMIEKLQSYGIEMGVQ